MSIGGVKPISISAASKIAMVVFDGVKNHRFSLDTGSVSIPWSQVSIYKPDNSALLAPTWVNSSGRFIDVLTLPASGTYAILVDPDTTNTGNMTLSLYDVPPDASGSIVVGGSAVAVAATAPGQNPFLTFSGAAGQRVSLNATSVTIPWSQVSIRNPDTSFVLSPIWVNSFGRFIDPVTLPATGTYTLVIDPENANIGSMTVALGEVPADIVGSISAGGSAVTVTAAVPGHNPSLTFSGTLGQRVSLRMTSVSIPWSLVSIRKPDSSMLIAPTWVNSGGGFFDVQTLPSSGTYTIVVDPENTDTGSMTLALYDVPADATSTLTANGAAASITITTAGQNGALTFSSTQGQQVTVHVASNTIGDTTVALLKPDGTTQTSSSSSASSFDLATQTLPSTGTYTVRVDPSQWNTGSIQISVTSP